MIRQNRNQGSQEIVGDSVSPSGSSDGCPDAGELKLLVAGNLPQTRHDELEQHILACSRCQAVLAELDNDPSLVAALSDFAIPVVTDNGLGTGLPSGASGTERRLGDYRVIREIGRGGMGVVFEARQISLRRRVALKTLPSAGLLDPKRLQRFKNEAHAAALLHHPNIVPVYTFGVEEGIHYYAMQFIEGVNLSRILRAMQLEAAGGRFEAVVDSVRGANDTTSEAVIPLDSTDAIDAQADTKVDDTVERPPTESPQTKPGPSSSSACEELVACQQRDRKQYFRRTAELMMQAADALHFAHEQGVVHRDVKPSNLVIDHSGRLWVTDFGLAQLETDATLTMSGDIIGTLRYMSPEQSCGKPGRLDFRTDIYSLGATLYELLTLEPLFPVVDRQAILIAIANVEPRLLRSIDPEIPAELETIVLKAISKEPLDRYATAGEMADDLRRFLADMPIRAKRPSYLERTFKWVRRHSRLVTVAASLLAVIACLVVVGAVLLAAAWRSESHQRQIAEAAASDATAKSAEADAQRERAERNFRSAVKAVDQMFTQVGISDLADVPQMEPVRRDLAKKALQFYQEFLKERSDDRNIAYETGRAWVRAAYVQRILGNHQEGERSARNGLEMFESLGAEGSRDATHRLDVVMACEEIAMNLSQSERSDEALLFRDRALSTVKSLVRDFPEPVTHWIRLADANSAYGNAFFRSDQPVALAEPYHREALRILGEVKRRYPDEVLRQEGVDLLKEEAHKTHWLGANLLQQKRFEEAAPVLREAIELREKQLAREPDSPGIQHDLAHAIFYYCKLPMQLGTAQEREKLNSRGIQIMETLVANFPDTHDYFKHLVMNYRVYGDYLMNSERHEEACSVQRKLLDLMFRTQEKFPENGGQLSNIAWTYY
ncbi:MAG: protein kinase, partial [Planctomycetaceae bacterium]